MASTFGVSEFKINHRIKFRSLIRGHNMHQNIWSLYKREKLAARPNGREEALEYDKWAIPEKIQTGRGGGRGELKKWNFQRY